MTLFYLIGAFLLGVALFVNRNKKINYILITGFLILQWSFTIYACLHLSDTELNYFTFDSLGILLLLTLSIIAVPAAIHSRIYIENPQGTDSSRSIYFSALVILMTAIGAGYLSII